MVVLPYPTDMGSYLKQDPELMAAFNDPEVMAALQDGMHVYHASVAS